MFNHAISFNREILQWNPRHVRNMDRMFMNATVFNQALYLWNAPNIQRVPKNMFLGATSYTHVNPWESLSAVGLSVCSLFCL
jgi:hypothetical protein